MKTILTSISEFDLENLRNSSSRVRGSLRAITDTKAEFHAWAKGKPRNHRYHEFGTPNAKTRIYPDKVDIHISCNRNTPGLVKKIQDSMEGALAVIEDLD